MLKRKGDGKYRAVFFACLESDRAAKVFFTEQLHAVGAKASSLFGFRAEGTLKNLQRDFIGYFSGIVDSKNYSFVFDTRSDADCFSGANSFQRILYHIGENSTKQR